MSIFLLVKTVIKQLGKYPFYIPTIDHGYAGKIKKSKNEQKEGGGIPLFSGILPEFQEKLVQLSSDFNSAQALCQPRPQPQSGWLHPRRMKSGSLSGRK